MPYTITVAETEAEARQLDPDLSIEYQIHQRIFNPDIPLYDLQLFYNLSDFYQNAAFLEASVIGLRGEVEEARQRIEDPRTTETLSLLSKICERARKKGLNIFAFGE